MLLLLVACGDKTTEKNKSMERSQAELTENYVDTMTLRLTDFDREVVCNGHLRAKVKSLLTPRHSDVITSINVQEGQWVEQGTLLAVTDETAYMREVEKAEREVEKTRIDLADKLITMGYDIDANLNQ